MYESPITRMVGDISSQITKQNEEYIITYARDIGYNINKEELTKALNYDREQYKAGYRDGHSDGYKEGFDDATEIVFKTLASMKGTEEGADVNA